MSRKKIVEISAPHHGLVEDVNIFGICAELVAEISGSIKQESFVNKSKAEIDGFELKREPDGFSLELRIGASARQYSLGKVVVEVTNGGVAYNIFQNLYRLNNSLRDGLALEPVIGLPSKLIEALKTKGMHHESEYFLPFEGRKSLMMVYDNGQLNLVSKGAAHQDMAAELPTPDVVVFSTYPQDMNAKEVDKVVQYGNQNPDLKVYFNPGSTQVRIGVEGFKKLMPKIALASMKLDEARIFLGIDEDYGDRDNLAAECTKRFLGEGVKICIINDSANGSYIMHDDKKGPYHIQPFPKNPIEELLKKRKIETVENFSGCGDGIFSTILYASEVFPEMNLRGMLAFANSIARLISLFPESNLYRIDNGLVREAFELSGQHNPE